MKDDTPSPFAVGAVLAGILLVTLYADLLPWQKIGETLAGMWR